ncbi:hypothetical protein FHX49_002740 [Microbacterium endophyticum]|uniref:Uncharacterized protein n=1 Tax=Microbacterium endophyticum TaxID=1526412 RepID=A0A7W4V5C1_9MICO|nr:hypothetical protein [Microbacterium endophyticum]MBB2977143.1 hypothetical protein [Microbacterium endophyticum]NIK36071.1 hypothetical protein [Microbacterium endophyticum]
MIIARLLEALPMSAARDLPPDAFGDPVDVDPAAASNPTHQYVTCLPQSA